MVDEQQVASRGPMKKDLLAFRSENKGKNLKKSFLSVSLPNVNSKKIRLPSDYFRTFSMPCKPS
jgi:hypothetical protein